MYFYDLDFLSRLFQVAIEKADFDYIDALKNRCDFAKASYPSYAKLPSNQVPRKLLGCNVVNRKKPCVGGVARRCDTPAISVLLTITLGAIYEYI